VIGEKHAYGRSADLGKPIGHVAGRHVEVETLVGWITGSVRERFGDGVRLDGNTIVTIGGIDAACGAVPYDNRGWFVCRNIILYGLAFRL
jgi:sugar (pentulose or hexulose) kinase